MNTVSFYMRILRAVNNRAVAEGIVEQRYPFKQVYTGNEKTDNKAVEERIQPGADCRQEPLGGNCDGISRNDISLDLGG